MSEHAHAFCEFCAAPLMAYHGTNTGSLGQVLQRQAQKCFCRMNLQEAEALVRKLQQEFEDYVEYNMPIGTSKKIMRELIANMPRQDPRRVELQQRLSYLDRIKEKVKALRQERKGPSEAEQLQPGPRTMRTVRRGSLAALIKNQGKQESKKPKTQQRSKRRM